ncbi:putative flavoprotein [Annulohypoxylon truncatum]|uniref:putative flavoprotein n=1 Tax=Annulohypoxylon truncatum TaxID=327061 RepID=UPI002007A160|nr:putative flavoprotein [Annulohypoxylon truncatum]KAI1206948.1 putative flavoprotein [Annulohypoxylon truncatum]
MGSLGQPRAEYDVLIIGAGFSGICALHHIRERFPSWRVKVLEASSGVGGTWWANRYPGARVDTESLTYQFSWDKELLQEWYWKETFSTQPDVLRYLERVCEKHDLYKDIQLDTRIKSAEWLDGSSSWLFADSLGSEYRARFFVSCMGFLSQATLPAIPGIEDFQGRAFHTSAWPRDLDVERDFAGKKVGVIGTGATGIQTITAIAKASNFDSLTVFQRTANWSAPLRNTEISPEQMKKHAQEYDSIFGQCAKTSSGFLYQADPRRSCDVTPEERLALWEKLYNEQGFGKWLGVFKDTYTDREANHMYSEYMAAKIRARIDDPEVADSLVPKNHGFGLRRVPLESGYFEVYNRPDVKLVDLKKTPIERVNAAGIDTQDGKHHDLDILIYATGFDAITGSFRAIDFRGKGGRPLLGYSDSEKGSRAIWVDHKPKTFLGIMVPDMPNMFMVLGPHQPFGNGTRSLENAVNVVCDMLQHMFDHDYTYVEPKPESIKAWGEHVVDCSKGLLGNEIDSWMTGVNTNVKGKQERNIARYLGNVVGYRKRCSDCAESGWKDLAFA